MGFAYTDASRLALFIQLLIVISVLIHPLVYPTRVSREQACLSYRGCGFAMSGTTSPN